MTICPTEYTREFMCLFFVCTYERLWVYLRIPETDPTARWLKAFALTNKPFKPPIRMPESPGLLVPVGAELMAVAQRRWTPPGDGAGVEEFFGT